MKPKSCVALGLGLTSVWSVADHAYRDEAPPLWRAAEVGARPLGAWAVGVLRDEEGRWPGFQAAGAPPSAAVLARYERELCDLANRERARRKLPLLKISLVLADVARGHSREMAARGYFSHDSPVRGRRTPQDRFEKRAGRKARLIAENIYKLESSGFYRLQARDFRRAHTGWMESPGHRANILRVSPAGGPTHIGVGIVVRGGSFWATQNFARFQ